MVQNIEKNRKIAFITGAAKRLGRATALKLHENDIDVIIHCNNSAKEANKLALELNAKRNDSAFVLQFNLRDFIQYKNILSTLPKRWSDIDVLINNASTFYPTIIKEASLDEWDDLHDVNLKSPFFLSQYFFSSLKKNRGCIINIIDIHADRPLDDFSIYSVAKSGLKMLTKSLALEFGPNIRVNGVSPGSIMWPEIKEYENQHQEIIDSTALKKQGNTSDIANTCMFLINNADYITGQIISVDGGRSLSR